MKIKYTKSALNTREDIWVTGVLKESVGSNFSILGTNPTRTLWDTRVKETHHHLVSCRKSGKNFGAKLTRGLAANVIIL